MITLVQVDKTRLYQPTGQEQQYVVFLLWEQSTSPPPQFSADDTWSDTGPPDRIGWYVFTNATTRDATFEAALRAQLPEPERTSFAWAAYKKPPASFAAQVPVKANGDGAPVVERDVPVELPEGLIGVGFAGGAPVRAALDKSGDVDGFGFGYPPAEGPPPRGVGIAVPLAGGAAGTIKFTGFVNADGKADAEHVAKSLVDAQIDPLRVFNRKRTFTSLTGRDFHFVHDSRGYRLVPLEGGAA